MSEIDYGSLTDEEREELERRRREGKPTLDEDIVRRYEPDRLARIMVRGAGRGEALDLATRSEMEQLLPGHDFSGVRVFRGPLAEEITQRHSADAITIANTGIVLMRSGPQSAPGTTAGKALLAHELTHVAQAQRGMLFAKEGGSEGEYEAEAEEVQEDAAAGANANVARDLDSGSSADTDRATDMSAEVRKTQAKRDAVITRAIEMIKDEERNFKDRRGVMGHDRTGRG